MQSSGSCSALFLASTHYLHPFHTLSTYIVFIAYIYLHIHYLHTIFTLFVLSAQYLLCSGHLPMTSWSAGPSKRSPSDTRDNQDWPCDHRVVDPNMSKHFLGLELCVHGLVDAKNGKILDFIQLDCGMVRISSTPTIVSFRK